MQKWTEVDRRRSGPKWTEAYWIQKWARDPLRIHSGFSAAVGVRSGPEVGRGGGGEVDPKWYEVGQGYNYQCLPNSDRGILTDDCHRIVPDVPYLLFSI